MMTIKVTSDGSSTSPVIFAQFFGTKKPGEPAAHPGLWGAPSVGHLAFRCGAASVVVKQRGQGGGGLGKMGNIWEIYGNIQ